MIVLRDVNKMLIDWLIDWLINWLIDWLIDWLIEQKKEVTKDNRAIAVEWFTLKY